MGIVQTLLIIFGLMNLAFAGFLYFHSNKGSTITFYALISVFASLWALSTLATGIIGLPFKYFVIAANGHYIFGYLAYLSFFWFALYYPEKPKAGVRQAVLFTALTCGYLVLIPTTPILFSNLAPGSSIHQQITFNTPGYVAFIVMLSMVFFAGLSVLLQKLKQTTKEVRFKEFDRYQIYFAILANFLAGVLGISLNLIFPLYGNFDFFYVNPILVTLALTGIGLYNLLKYNLFNTKVVLAEFFTAGLGIFSLARLIQSSNTNEWVINSILCAGTLAFGVFLIQSVLREVKIREQLENVTEDLQKANERLKELDRQKTEFVSIASHQLRSPLTAIKGYSSLLLEGSMGKLTKAAEESIQKIFESSKYMALSIEDFLSVSRIELGTVKYDRKEFDFAKMVKDVTDSLQPAAAEKGLSLRFEGTCDGTCAVKGDIGKLRQVLLNLIDNSMKYTPKGSITVTAHVDRKKGIAHVEVEDTGVGITPETLPKLFRKFSRAANANEVNVMGTGLGLFVARQFVEAHGGRVWAESEGQGKGSTFVVEIPLVGVSTRETLA